MFGRLRYYFYDYRVWAVIGFISAVGGAYFGGDQLKRIAIWAAIILGALLFIALVVWVVRKIRARRAAARLNSMVEGEADRAVAEAQPTSRAETEALRERMLEAIKAIKSSRIGVLKGRAALYELPWYVIIGNPAAGKSSAVLNSGLKFPFQDSRGSAVQGIGGTRNCDWYFTTEGIVIDTAGRYSVNNEDKQEWLTFLGLLKKNRPRAPINGIIIAANIAELSDNGTDFAVELAKNLRQRVQEVTEQLEVFAPVYVVFTKADLIAGFTEFFRNMDTEERDGVWGATFPYDPKAENDAVSAFDIYFDELTEGLREMSLHQMAIQRGQVSPGLLTLPLEFVGIKPALRTFIATLFEENPYQFRPVFRGFYFTSSLQEGRCSHHASERIGRQFGLQSKSNLKDETLSGNVSHFLKDLFRRVIFADKQLVKQYSSPRQTRLRYTVFLSAIAGLAIMLGLWTWSYTSNKQLVDSTTRDFAQIIAMQKQGVDLQSRLEALVLLQEHLERLERYRRQHRITTRLGLYQGRQIEAKLKQEYFHGMRQVMLRPVATKLELFLSEVVERRNELTEIKDQQSPSNPLSGETLYQQVSPTNADDAYNALKTYLMLGNPKRVEPAHLGHQLTIFWRDWLEASRGKMSREETARFAEKLMTFYVAHYNEPSWPRVETKVTLINDSRSALMQVMKGQPAIERVFTQIKARAATRYPTITVNSLIGEERNQNTITGNYAISGAFSYEAWNEYIRNAVKEAANTELSAVDWVLDTTQQSDLSVYGSPESISRDLISLYKQEYAREWQRFMQGIGIAEFKDFDDAVVRMNRLGDANDSPLRALLIEINRQTVWDNPGASSRLSSSATSGLRIWFRRNILRQSDVVSGTGMPTGASASSSDGERSPMGPIGKAFEGFAKLMTGNETAPALINSYFDTLGKLRSRLNTIKTQGAPGPGARKLMQDTLSNEGSELNAALALVDDQLMTGLEESQRSTLRPLLLRSLVQTFSILIPATETEVNNVWKVQVYDPFRNTIGRQYPFSLSADVDAAASDVAAIFGPTGAIAAFNKDTLGTLVIQRGNVLEPRRWAGMGITLSPVLVTSYGEWVSGQQIGGAAGQQDTTIFQILPSPAIGAVEYTVEIDGQTLRYRNTPPQWETFQWPNASGIPGARVSAVTGDGRTVDLINAPGPNGFNRLMQEASITPSMDGHKLTWTNSGISVSIDIRIVRSPSTVSGGSSDWRRGLQLPAQVVGNGPVVASPSP